MRQSNNAPEPRDTPPRPDRLVFLAVLAAGTIVIVFCRVSPVDLVADLGALATLYTAYRRS